MTAQPPILVTDGGERAALAVVRSLGRAGYLVHVAAPAHRSIAGASRYARGHEVVADPLLSPREFVDDVASFVRRRSAGVVIPITDAALLALTAERARLGDVILPWPDGDGVRRVADKALLVDVAREVGIAVPEQRAASSAEEALAAAEQLRFPLVVKPSRSVREQGSGRATKLTVGHAADRAALRARLAELQGTAYPILLQERVVGPGIGVSLLVWDGRIVAHFAHRRVRERPPAGGVSVCAVSIAPDETLVERSAALLRRFDWKGVAMVEYKLDATSGTPYLIEINGRFWGSLQLAIDAGVDFPRLLVDAVRGVRGAPPPYHAGVRFRWWWGDVDHLLVRLARSPRRLSLPPGAPSRARVVRDFLAAGWPHRDNDVFRLDDPNPFVVETLGWLGNRIGVSGLGRAHSSRTPAAGQASSAATPAV